MDKKEIVIGACYRAAWDGEVVRVLEETSRGVWRCVVLATGRGAATGEMVERADTSDWSRVPDPTPAIVEEKFLIVSERDLRLVERVRTRLHSEQRLNGDEMRDLGHALDGFLHIARSIPYEK